MGCYREVGKWEMGRIWKYTDRKIDISVVSAVDKRPNNNLSSRCLICSGERLYESTTWSQTKSTYDENGSLYVPIRQ